MKGTIYSTSGLNRTTRLNPHVKWRLVGLLVAFLAGTILILWINNNIGQEMDRLQNEFTIIKSERFYMAVHMRSTVRKLNSILLDFHLSRRAEDMAAFQTESVALERWLTTHKPAAMTPREQDLFHQWEVAYDIYLAHARRMLAGIELNSSEMNFSQAYESVRRETRPLNDLFEELVIAQRAAFDLLLADSRQTVDRLHRLFSLSVWLLSGLTVALVLLTYRSMILPLRRELDQSRGIIERQEKLASLGLLAAGVAHEIRNPLTAIKFRLFSLKKSLPAEFPNHEDARVIEGEIHRLERIVNGFLQFARPADPEWIEVPAERILEEVHDLFAPQLAKLAIRLQLEIETPARVRADTQQLKQVLINLIQNSAESIERDGTILLRLRRTTAEFDGRNRSNAVALEVADTGKGLSPEAEKRLYDPFFSTKENGTGLGLSIAARIVAKHNGVIRHRSELNRGTTFEILLPPSEH